MKVLVLNGSPKKNSDTMQLTNSFLEGLNVAGSNEIEIINVIDKNIAPCRGCFGCWQNGDGKCVIQDDQNEILDKYLKVDLVIWSFPLYCFGFPSHIKAVLDRIIPFVKMDMVEHNGEVSHVARVDLGRIKYIIICGAGFPASDRNFEGVSITCDKCFPACTKIFVPETPMLNIPNAKPMADVKRNRFKEAGIEFFNNGCLTNATITELESLMIPNEDYIKMVNA